MTVDAPARRETAGRWVPLALIALMVIPAVSGSLRILEIVGGPHLMPANARLTTSPVPVTIHIVSAILYAVLGAFQFSARLRRLRPSWHRVSGRALVLLGLAVAGSAAWMTQFHARQPGTGELAYVFRLAFGFGMAACILLGFSAIRRGDVPHHLAWMTRAYALALGAGTQTFTLGIGKAVLGPGALTIDLMLGLGWVVNLAIAEVVIRRQTSSRRSRGTTARVVA